MMLLFRLFFTFIFLMGASAVRSTPVFPINSFSDRVIHVRSGLFTDSGREFHTPYAPNENYSTTICPADGAGQVLEMFFENFKLGDGDVLHIYDGNTPEAPLLIQATGTALNRRKVHSSSGCLHFRFVSSPSGEAGGWEASIQNVGLCETFSARILPRAGTFDYCQNAGQVVFDASAAFATNPPEFDPGRIVYSWRIANQPFSGATLSHTFAQAGAYTIALTATDPVSGCTVVQRELVRIVTKPVFTGTFAPDTVCASEPFSLLGMVHPTTWTGFVAAIAETAAIPEAPGAFYQSQLNFNIFQPGDFVLTATDIQQVCVTLEHEISGQVQIELECPSGSIIQLKNFSQQNTNLGEPVVWDPAMPGKGYQYCFVNNAAFGTINQTSPRFHSYTDRAGNFYFNAPFLPSGNFTPEMPFSALTACPLNGTWTLRVRDNQPGANGFIFGWKLFFREEFYHDSLKFTPQTTRTQWFRGNTPLTGNPATSSIAEHGSHIFRFEATDNFGCRHDTALVVHVRRLPQAEIHSKLELPMCQGDSTLLRVVPIGANLPEWAYQWFRGGTPIPGAVYDTLWARTPGLYSVRITDLTTNCVNFFEIQVTDKNCDLIIPNVFTPNFDGINDVFEIVNLEHYQASILIFNRWGRKVFEHSDYYNNWWDGGNAPAGTYFYILTFTRGEVRRTAEGVITLIR